MKKYKQLLTGSIVSVVLHGTLFVVFFLQPQSPHDAEVEIDFISVDPHPRPGPVEKLPPARTAPKSVNLKNEHVDGAVADNPVPSEQKNIVPQDSLPHLTHQSFSLDNTAYKTRKLLIEHPDLQVKPDPTIHHRERPFYTKPDGLEKKENILLKLFDAPKDPSLDFIPSVAQIEALDIIFKQKQVTDIDIYSQIDTTLKITAVDMNKALTALTEKGIVARKIASPQNKFRFFILPEEWGVEMSGKNKRNRVYEYTPQIDREQLLTFLNAALYQVESGLDRPFQSRMDSTLLSRTIKKDILQLMGK